MEELREQASVPPVAPQWPEINRLKAEIQDIGEQIAALMQLRTDRSQLLSVKYEELSDWHLQWVRP